jgi:Domain of unknown function (DUF397)
MQNPVFANWHKSNHSDDGGCVEIAYADGMIGVRDTKDPSGPTLVFNQHEWTAFTKGVRDGSLTPEG